MRVLVTGGRGFIGHHVLPILVAGGHEVHAVSSRELPQQRAGATWHQADLLESGESEKLVAAIRPSHLLHLAWYAEPGKYWTAVENFSWVEATLGLVRAFHRHGGCRAVMAGTCAEYDWDSGTCREDATPLRPKTVYGICKHATQLLLDAFSRATGLSSAWGRVFFLYGPGEKLGRLVPQVVRALLAGRPAACTSGEQVRDFLHVTDAARAFAMLLQTEHTGPLNIASGRPVAIREVVATIARQIGRPDLLRPGALPIPEGEALSIVGDNAHLAALGWSPRLDLDEGVRQTIEWWRANGGRR